MLVKIYYSIPPVMSNTKYPQIFLKFRNKYNLFDTIYSEFVILSQICFTNPEGGGLKMWDLDYIPRGIFIVDQASKTVHNGDKTGALLRKFEFRVNTTVCLPTGPCSSFC